MFLVRYGQFLATLCATVCQYTATIGSSHSLTKTVLVVAATVVWLKCSFHDLYLFICFRTKYVSGCKITYFFEYNQTFLPFFLGLLPKIVTFARVK